MYWHRAVATEQALQKLGDVIRRKHLALATERSYRAWLKRYCDFIQALPAPLSSERKLEQFLTALAREDVAASMQNQAFNAVLFFYKTLNHGWTQMDTDNRWHATLPCSLRIRAYPYYDPEMLS